MMSMIFSDWRNSESKKINKLRNEEVLREDSIHVIFIKSLEEYKIKGYHKNLNIERKDMKIEIKKTADSMEEIECINDDLLRKLNIIKQHSLRKKLKAMKTERILLNFEN